MKICYLANNAIPSTVASAIQIIKMCEALSKNKNEVSLICPNSNKIEKNIFDFYNVKTKFNIEKLSKFKKFPLGLNYYLFSVLSIIKSFKYKPQIYITRNFFTAFILTLIKKKVILEIHHDIEIESRITRFLIKFFKVLNSKNIIRIVAISKKVKEYYLQNYNIKKNKVIVLPSGSSIKLNLPILSSVMTLLSLNLSLNTFPTHTPSSTISSSSSSSIILSVLIFFNLKTKELNRFLM